MLLCPRPRSPTVVWDGHETDSATSVPSTLMHCASGMPNSSISISPNRCLLLAADRLEVLWVQDTTLPPSILDKKWSLHAPPFLDRRRCFRFLLELLQVQQFQVIRSLRLRQWQVSEVALSSRAACAHAVEGRGLETGLCTPKGKPSTETQARRGEA